MNERRINAIILIENNIANDMRSCVISIFLDEEVI